MAIRNYAISILYKKVTWLKLVGVIEGFVKILKVYKQTQKP